MKELHVGTELWRTLDDPEKLKHHLKVSAAYSSFSCSLLELPKQIICLHFTLFPFSSALTPAIPISSSCLYRLSLLSPFQKHLHLTSVISQLPHLNCPSDRLISILVTPSENLRCTICVWHQFEIVIVEK